MKKQEVLDKVVDRITGGQGEQNRDRIPGFSEVEVDPGFNRIVLRWNGELPGSVQGVLQDLPKGVSVQVVRLPHFPHRNSLSVNRVPLERQSDGNDS
ncbi:hypothetical protein ACH4E7_44605 [Kitasatospora sp. NPDC018058]|uniref:hypothetical protein n=1 Tax=Kitasatospora sp. NPDC018058 TaxID=3364025 RepID=UPI0037BE5A75